MYFYTYKFIYIMWNILHLSAFLLVAPTIFYQCTYNASGTLRQFSDLQQYLSESEKGGRGQWPNYYALPGRERSKYWFNSRTVTNTDSSFYGMRVNPTEKRGLTPNIVLCTHIRSDTVFQCRKTQLKGWLKQEYLNAINGLFCFKIYKKKGNKKW
jgi:hypothetical protein